MNADHVEVDISQWPQAEFMRVEVRCISMHACITNDACHLREANWQSWPSRLGVLDLRQRSTALPVAQAIVRPWRLQDVVHELSAHGILGMTATQVLGVGVQGGERAMAASLATAVYLTPHRTSSQDGLPTSAPAQARGNGMVAQSMALRTSLRR